MPDLIETAKKIVGYAIVAGVAVGLIYLSDSCKREERERKRLEELVKKTAMSEVYRELGVEYNSDNPRQLTIEEIKKYLRNHNIRYRLN